MDERDLWPVNAKGRCFRREPDEEVQAVAAEKPKLTADDLVMLREMGIKW